MSNALGEGAVSTPLPTVARKDICKINGKKEEK
jgi:spore maturation protein SpmA